MNSTVSEPTKKLPQPNVQRQLSQTIGGMSPILRTPGTQANSTMTPQVRKTVRKTVRPLPSESKFFIFFLKFQIFLKFFFWNLDTFSTIWLLRVNINFRAEPIEYWKNGWLGGRIETGANVCINLQKLQNAQWSCNKRGIWVYGVALCFLPLFEHGEVIFGYISVQ